MTIRELVRSYGLDDEQTEEVMKAHGLAVQNEQKKTEAERALKEEAQKALTEAKNALKTKEKEAADVRSLNEEIGRKNAEISALRTDLKKLRIHSEITTALHAAGALDPATIEQLIDTEKITEGEDGKITGIDAEIKRIKEGEFTGLLFKSEKPVHKDTYPVQTSHGEAKTQTESIGRQAAREAAERKVKDSSRKQFFEF